MIRIRNSAAIGLVLPALVVSTVWAGCEPEEVKMNLLVYSNATDSYVFDNVEVRTLDDVNRLQGKATTLVGGSSLELDYGDGVLTWERAGHSVAFESIKRNGVLIPEDYHSLAMASIYYSLELSMLFFFDALGLPQGALNKMRTYYWADMKIIEPDGEEYNSTDNAFYMYLTPKEQAFFVVPFDQFEWIPMPLNSGIITHEYSHAVFDSLVYDLSGDSGLVGPGVNFLAGVNEGCADFFAVARTLDPDYLAHSIPKGLYVIECNYPGSYIELVRDASIPMNYSDLLDEPARDLNEYEFCPYDIGSFFAALLYEISIEIDQSDQDYPTAESLTRVAKWLLRALDDLGVRLSGGNQQDFEIWELLSNIVVRMDSEEDRASACSIIENRYEMYYSEVQGCQ